MSARFSLQPIGRFAGTSQAVKRPKVSWVHGLYEDIEQSHQCSFCNYIFKCLHYLQEFACFSYDDNHEFHLDDSSIKYYYTPQLGADLSKGFDTFQKLDDTGDDHLDSLLKTIAAHEQETGKKIDANIVTWRGMMTKVWCPFPWASRPRAKPNYRLWQRLLTIWTGRFNTSVLNFTMF